MLHSRCLAQSPREGATGPFPNGISRNRRGGLVSEGFRSLPGNRGPYRGPLEGIPPVPARRGENARADGFGPSEKRGGTPGKARLLLEATPAVWEPSEFFFPSRNRGLVSFALGTRERQLETASLELATEYYERTREAGGRAVGRILESLAEGIDELALKLDAGLERFIEVDTLCHRCAGLVAVKTGLAPRGTAEIPDVGAEIPALFPPLSRAFWAAVSCDEPFRTTQLLQTLEENLGLIEAHARRTSPRAENRAEIRADEAEWKGVLEGLPPGSAYAEMKDDPLAEAISRHPPEGKSLAVSAPPQGYTEGLLFHLTWGKARSGRGRAEGHGERTCVFLPKESSP